MIGKTPMPQPASPGQGEGGAAPLVPAMDTLHARHGNGAVARAALAGPSALAAAAPSGRGGLPGGVRSSMESAFGRSFSGVRVSEGERVRPGQLAVTEGPNIDFAPGHFQPETPAGRFLLAHELTHVVQQQNGGGAAALAKSDGSRAPARPDLEREANEVGSQLAGGGGGPVQVQGTVSPGEPVTLAFEAREHILAAWKDYKGWVRYGKFYIPWAFTVTFADLFHSIDEAQSIAKNDPEQFEAVLSLLVALPVPGRERPAGKGGPVSIASEEPNDDLAINKKIGTDNDLYFPRLSAAQDNIDALLLVAAVDPGQFRGSSLKGGKRKREEDYPKRIRETIKERYLALADQNVEHYLNPERGDLGRSTLEKIERGQQRNEKGEKSHPNLGGTYREYHELAIDKAVANGQQVKGLDDALVVEGWAAHFLSDAFASGHLRTVRRDAAEYWDKKLPFFYTNMIGYVSEAVAKELKAHSWLRGLSVNFLVSQARGEIIKQFKKFPKVGGGQAMYALPSHDYDNSRDRGVLVIIKGKRIRLRGDTRLDQATMDYARDALRLSRGEVTQAYSMGSQGKGAADVKSALKQEELYAAEHLIPIVVPDEELGDADQSLKWENRSVEEMLNDTTFQKALARFLELKADDFEGVIANLGDTKRNALKATILEDMKKRPVELIRKIILWKPTLRLEADDIHVDPAENPRRPAAATGAPVPGHP